MNLLLLKNLNIYRQLQIEEALLKTDLDSWCLINEGTPAAVILGVSNTIEEKIDERELSKINIPIIRRFSGGGAVLVDENTIFVTFILSEDLLPISPDKIFSWSENFYKKIFQNKTFFLQERDFTIEGKKCGGNAQYLKQKRALHHTSFLWDYEIEKMNLLKVPKRAPSYRKNRSHKEFLCSLKDHFTSKSSFIERIVKNLNEIFIIKELGLNEIDAFLLKEHVKSTQEIFPKKLRC